jgi:membrane fusion protein, multidrug efflux system
METARQATSAATAPTAVPQPKNDVGLAAADAPARKRRPFLILGVIAVVAIAAVGGYSVLTAGHEGTDDAQIAADVVPVSARVTGVVSRVAIVENQRVKRGDLLLELDPADFAARAQQAEAELANAQAQAQAADAQVQIVEATSKGGLATARAGLLGSAAGVGSAEAQLASARASAARADADLKKADIDLGRARALRAAGAVPQENLDTAEIQFEAARAGKAQAAAQVALAEDARRSAESRVGEARGRVDQSTPVAPQIASAQAGAALAAARVRGAEAALALAKLQLGYTRILAPAGGYASKLAVHEGQQISMGQPAVELVPAASYLVANFKETQVGAMRPGQPVTINVDAYPGVKLKGRVESLAGGTGATFSLLPPDNASGNFVKVVQRVPVRIAWVDPPADLVLLPGLSADVTVNVRP